MLNGTNFQRLFAALILVVTFTVIVLLHAIDSKPNQVINQSTNNVTILLETPARDDSDGTKDVAPSSVGSVPPAKDALGSTNVTVFIESFDDLNAFYGNSYTRMEKEFPFTCQLPHGGSCILHHSDTFAPTSDVVFRMVRLIHPNDTVRYHEGQLLAVFNSEAERGEYGLQQLREADIRIDHHPYSEIMLGEICDFPVHKLETSPPADPAERKGIAMFTSNCEAKWRLDYFEKLTKAVHIDSYGKCLHNKDEPPVANNAKYASSVKISSKYRMVVTFENLIQDDYISEKIGVVFASGAIPVYWGPPQIYSWVPGNHSFIDASKYSPEDLAKYLKRVDEDDDLFKYHTSNFDVNRTKEMIERLCLKGVNSICRMCQIAQEKLLQRTEGLK